MNLAQLPTVVGTHNVQLTSRCTGVPHAPLQLHSRSPRLPPPRSLPPSPSPCPPEAGGLVAQEPRPYARGDRTPGRCLPSQRPTLPRRVRRRGPGAPPPSALEGQAQRTGDPSSLLGRLLPGEPAALDPRSPSGHRARNRRLPQPDPGACLFKKTLGLRWRKVGAIPAKADPQEQADFVKTKLRPVCVRPNGANARCCSWMRPTSSSAPSSA